MLFFWIAQTFRIAEDPACISARASLALHLRNRRHNDSRLDNSYLLKVLVLWQPLASQDLVVDG
jgi:hypothetical protein